MRVLRGKAVRRSVIVVAGAAALAVPAQAPAATSQFLSLNGIQGESQDDQFADSIEVKDWSWGATRAAGIAKAQTQDFTIKKDVDRSSPALLQKLYNGQAISNGSLSIRNSGEQPFVFLKFCFTNLKVTSVDVGAGDEGVPESVSFSFGSIVEKYVQQDEAGGAGDAFRFGWDVVKYLELSTATQNAC